MTYDKLLMLDNMGLGFTAKASETISGGQLVGFFDGEDVVGSVASTYDWDDIGVDVADATNGLDTIGIALTTQTSGGAVGIAQQGTFILPVGSVAVSGGEPVRAAGYASMVVGFGAGSQDGRSYRGIGRALSDGTAVTGFSVVRLSV